MASGRPTSVGSVASGRPPARPPLIGARWEAPDARRRLQLALAGLWLLDAGLAVWGSLVLLTAVAASPQGLHDTVAASAAGEPGWITAMDHAVAAALAGRGVPVSAVLAVALAVIAAGVFLSVQAARGVLILAVVVAAVIWAGQGFGGIFTGSGTDPNSGPLLALLAAAYWPRRAPAPGQAGR